MLCSQLSRTSGVRGDFLSPRFVPEGQFDTVPESELVVDDSEVIFDDVLCGSDFVRDLSIFESLGNELNDSLFSFAGDTISVTLFSEHSCLR
jgi:hypothetical protein